MNSQKTVRTIGSNYFLLALSILTLLFLWVRFDFSIVVVIIIFVFQLLYFLMTYYKGLLFVLSFFNSEKVDEKEIQLKRYPTFNLLLPNYKEKFETLKDLIQNLERINYPKDKIKGFLIIQEDDEQSLAAVSTLKLPNFIELLIIPPVQPGEIQSKPRALNYGLKKCEAEIITIFDSEDEPDVNQLLKVAKRFEETDATVIQCNIGIYNSNQNFISRFFAAEFRCFFQHLLKGISGLRSTFLTSYLPLGGTSFYVKKEMMDKIGEFDMFNPTEDLIFSSSVYKMGGEIEHHSSITFGEAPVNFKQLINQRTRWVKGFMISSMILNRNLFQSWKEIGFFRWLTFNLWTLGSLLGLTIPFLIVFTLTWTLSTSGLYERLIPDWLWVIGYGGLLIGGSIISVLIFAIPSLQSGRFIDVLLTPIFIIFSNFILMVAAYKALYQLIFKPSMAWVKTEHGLAQKDELIAN